MSDLQTLVAQALAALAEAAAQLRTLQAMKNRAGRG